MATGWLKRRSWVTCWGCVLVMLALPAAASAEQPLTDAEEGEAAADEKVLTLEQLVELACKHNPDIAIARAQRDAARGQLIQAGLYLNPTFSWEAEDLNHVGKAAGKQGPIIGQEVITARKRRIAQAAAAAGVSAADWQALTRWYEVLTRTRSAYYDLLTGRQAVQASEEIVGLARDNLAAAQKLLKAGAGVQPDVLRAQVELDQSIVQQNVAQQRLTAAGQVLASVVGVAQLKASDVQGAFPAEVPGYTWETAIATVLSRSSMVQQAQALVSQAEELHQLARAQRWPNVRLSVRPFWDFPDERYETTVIIGAPLPIFNRNQGNILSAEADLARAHEEVRQVELRLRERLAGAFQRYESARREVEVYSKQVLPNARESLRLIRIGYEKGDPKYDFNALQQAQRTVAQARLLYVQAQGELWRAVSEIAGLLQEDAPMRDCLNP